MAVMIATAAVLMVAHTIEVLVWALAYAVVGAAPVGGDLLYFAFVNYTTLGYGDITPVQEWRLQGPMTAMNGILMFGWSAAVLFEVLRKTLDDLGVTKASASGDLALTNGIRKRRTHPRKRTMVMSATGSVPKTTTAIRNAISFLMDGQ